MWKGFHPKTNLTRHKKVHLNGKFTCNRCFEHFGSETSLEEHASKVHSTSVNQPTKFFVRPVERSHASVTRENSRWQTLSNSNSYDGPASAGTNYLQNS